MPKVGTLIKSGNLVRVVLLAAATECEVASLRNLRGRGAIRETHKTTQIVAMDRMTRRAPQMVSCQLSSSGEAIVVLRCEFVLSSSDFMPGD